MKYINSINKNMKRYLIYNYIKFFYFNNDFISILNLFFSFFISYFFYLNLIIIII